MTDDYAERLVKAVEHIAKSLPLLLETLALRSGQPAAADPSGSTGEGRSSSGPIEEAVGYVDSIKEGKVKTGKNAGSAMWFVKLQRGFEIGLFSSTQAKLAQDAEHSGRQLRITYTRKGKYKNLVGIALHGATPAPAAPPPTSPLDDDEVPF